MNVSPQEREAFLNEYMESAKDLVRRSREPVSKSIVDYLSRNGIFCWPEQENGAWVTKTNIPYNSRHHKILLMPVFDEDRGYEPGIARVLDKGDNAAVAMFCEGTNLLYLSSTKPVSRDWKGSLLLHEGHHSARALSQKIDHSNKLLCANIELEAILLQEEVFIGAYKDQYMACRAGYMVYMRELLTAQGKQLWQNANHTGFARRYDSAMDAMWGDPANDDEMALRYGFITLWAQLEMIAESVPVGTKQKQAELVLDALRLSA